MTGIAEQFLRLDWIKDDYQAHASRLVEFRTHQGHAGTGAGQCHAAPRNVDGLYVGDASIMPDTPSVATNPLECAGLATAACGRFLITRRQTPLPLNPSVYGADGIESVANARATKKVSGVWPFSKIPNAVVAGY
jgi:choline dehydrogenase-like flavoprotein